MTSPNIADLKAAFFGGGTDEEYQWLLDAQANGLTAQSLLDGSAYSAAFAPLGGPPLPMVAGLYFGPVLGTTTTAIPAEGLLMAQRAVVGRSCSISRIGVGCTVVGSSGAVVRLGIYGDNAAETRPGSLLLDAGTVNATAGTGLLAVTGLDLDVEVGDVLWLAAVVQGGAGTRPTLAHSANAPDPFIGSSTGSNVFNNIGSATVASVAGALPASPTWGLSGSPTIRLGVRADA